RIIPSARGTPLEGLPGMINSYPRTRNMMLSPAVLCEPLEDRALLSGENFSQLYADESSPIVQAGGLYFFGHHRLVVSDGTSAGTAAIKSFPAGIANMVAAGDAVYLAAQDGPAVNGAPMNLWRSDGTPGGTILLAKIAVTGDF